MPPVRNVHFVLDLRAIGSLRIVSALRLILLSLLLLAPASVHAATGIFAVEGDAPAKKRVAVLNVARRVLMVSGREVSPGKPQLTDGAMLVGCEPAEVSCREEIARSRGVDELLFGTLSVVGVGKASTYRLALTLESLSGIRATEVEVFTGSVGPAALNLTRRLVERVDAPHGFLHVESVPPGAVVLVGGEMLGETPLDVALPIGLHLLDLRGSGEARSVEVVLAAGDREEVRVDMTPPEPEKPKKPGRGDPDDPLAEPKPKRDRTSRVGMPAIAFMAGGTAVLITGIVVSAAVSAPAKRDYEARLATFPTDPTPEEMAELTDLLRRRDNRRTSANVTLALGVIGMTIGGTLLTLNMFGIDTDVGAGSGAGSDEPPRARARLALAWVAGGPGMKLRVDW